MEPKGLEYGIPIPTQPAGKQNTKLTSTNPFNNINIIANININAMVLNTHSIFIITINAHKMNSYSHLTDEEMGSNGERILRSQKQKLQGLAST